MDINTKCTLFMVSTVAACVQKQSCTDTKVMPACWQYSDVSIMCEESNEWMKLGGNAFFCFITLGRLERKKGEGGEGGEKSLKKYSTEAFTKN